MKGFSKSFLIVTIGVLMTAFTFTGCSDEKESKGLDVENIDFTVEPGQDFYQYAVGNWMANNPIPAEYTRWGSFEELAERNYVILKKMMEETSADSGAEKGSVSQLVGAFYASGMDSAKIEKLGAEPLKPELQKIDNIKNKTDFAKEVARMHMYTSNPLFYFYAGQDAKNSEMVIAQLSQAGLGLPDRDYYLNKDDKSKEIREKYVQHVENMFKLMGQDEKEAKQNAKTVMDIETKLAKASMTRVERRDPKKTYNKMSLAELANNSNGFDWKLYFNTLGLERTDAINVAQPEFMREVGKLTSNESLSNLKTYLKWNLVRSFAYSLSSDFVNERFGFAGTFLNGAEELQPRWKRMINSTNGALGEAVGQVYVKENFPPEAKEKALDLVNNVLAAMEERINNLEWMGEETKKQAIKKLNSLTVKIGYPDEWIDYSNIDISRDNYVQNEMNSNYAAFQRELAKIGNPVDRNEWEMNPQTVNAYFHPLKNEIVFPAAILQPPFFDAEADNAVNYGAIGAVIGHEITHGFDDQGRQYDAEGNIQDWWTKDDEERFNSRTKFLVDQYNEYMPVDTFRVNGELTLGENIADLGGLNVALTALEKANEGKEVEEIDGFTPEQRFFLSWAQVWRNNIRDENLLVRLKTDPHSPGKYRVIGPLVNMPEFYEAFEIRPEDPMARLDTLRVKIW